MTQTNFASHSKALYARLLSVSSGMENYLFLHARGWGVDNQEPKKLQIPGGGYACCGMVRGQLLNQQLNMK